MYRCTLFQNKKKERINPLLLLKPFKPRFSFSILPSVSALVFKYNRTHAKSLCCVLSDSLRFVLPVLRTSFLSPPVIKARIYIMQILIFVKLLQILIKFHLPWLFWLFWLFWRLFRFFQFFSFHCSIILKPFKKCRRVWRFSFHLFA